MFRLSSFVAGALLLTLCACSELTHSGKPSPPAKGARQQLSIGYSLLYDEADGVPKLDWLIRFKDKPEEMAKLTDELITYYRQLADRMEQLSKQYPAMQIHVQPLSEIEAETRKGIGVDLAKDIAPVIGKSGLEFERSALLTFHDSLNEQRHLVRAMLKRETVPALRDFLETTRFDLDSRYEKVSALLSRRYFVH